MFVGNETLAVRGNDSTPSFFASSTIGTKVCKSLRRVCIANASKLITTAHRAIRSGCLKNKRAKAEAAATFPGLISITNWDLPPIASAERRTSIKSGGLFPVFNGIDINSLYVISPIFRLDRSAFGSSASLMKSSSCARINFSSLVNAMSHSHKGIPLVHAASSFMKIVKRKM